MFKLRLRISLLLLLTLIISGCSFSGGKEEYVNQHYTTAARQFPAEPVYYRIFLARPPEVLPRTDFVPKDSPRVVPVIHLQLENIPLEQIAEALASSANYKSYCAAALARRVMSIDATGTIDEIADAISKKASISATVDHVNREVRFLNDGSMEPKLF